MQDLNGWSGNSTPRSAAWKIAQWLLGLVAVAFLTAALVRTWNQGLGRIDLSPWRLAATGMLLFLTNGALSRSWSALLGVDASRSHLVLGYLRALPGKYVPGGWAQPVGQIGMAEEAGAALGRAVVAYPVQAICLVVAGAVLGSGISLNSSVPNWIRWIAAGGLASAVLLRRRWLERLLAAVGRLLKKPNWGGLLPPQAAILASFAWSSLGLACMAASFAVLAEQPGGDVPAFLLVMSSFAFSWLSGYLAVPFPGGVGVREATLTAALSGIAPTSLAIGLAILHRLLQISTELLLALGAWIVVLRRPR